MPPRYRKKPIRHYSLRFDAETYDDLNRIFHLSRTPDSLAGVIRGMASRYRHLLEAQLAAEAAQGRLEIHDTRPYAADEPGPAVLVLDLRL